MSCHLALIDVEGRGNLPIAKFPLLLDELLTLF